MSVAWQDNGTTPLYIASQNGDVEVVKALVEAGAAVNQARVRG
jgi:ankyrin repeat protein